MHSAGGAYLVSSRSGSGDTHLGNLRLRRSFFGRRGDYQARGLSPSCRPPMLDEPPAASPAASSAARRQRLVGFAIVAVGLLGASPDGALIELNQSYGVDSSVAAYYKFVFATVISVLHAGYVCVFQLGYNGVVDSITNPWSMLTLALLLFFNTILMTLAFAWTSVVAAGALFNLNPIWAALLGAIFLNQRIHLTTVIALVFVGVAVLLLFMPDILGTASAPPEWQTHGQTTSAQGTTITSNPPPVVGNIFALLGGSALAVQVVLSAVVQRKGLSTSAVVLSVPVGNGMCLIASLLICAAKGVSTNTVAPRAASWQTLLVAFLDAFGCYLFNVASLIAPRYLTAVEVTSAFLLELGFAPVFAWALVGVPMSAWAGAGLALLLGTLCAHELNMQLSGAAEKANDAPDEVEKGITTPLKRDAPAATYKTAAP